MCGEKSKTSWLASKLIGSPPHVRGKESFPLIIFFIFRITPACAGKSNCPSSNRPSSKDHPRMCGEKVMFLLIVLYAVGSPPHVRGKVFLTLNFCLVLRITPACAGKSHCVSCLCSSAQDHPRMCGEKSDKASHHICLSGSPPHVRGKVLEPQLRSYP